MKFDVSELHVISESWGEDFDDFLLQVHCEIQEVGGAGGEAFLVYIVSPKALARELLSTGEFSSALGRGYLIVTEMDKNRILAALQKLIDGLHAGSWKELKEKVSKYFDWI